MTDRKNKKIIILDMDGCISNDKWRRDKLLDKRNTEVSTWKEYFDLCPQDVPIPSTLFTLDLLKEHYDIVVSTGRPDSIKKETLEWLKTNCEITPYAIFMRPQGVYSSNSITKSNNLDNIIESLEVHPSDITAFEDNTDAIDMYKRRNIRVIEVLLHVVQVTRE